MAGGCPYVALRCCRLHATGLGAFLLYVLDLDDTLYLERDFVRSGFQAVSEWLKLHRAVSGFFERAWDLFQKGIRDRIFDIVLEEMNLQEAGLLEEIVECYRSHKPNISLLPDAYKFLRNCHRDELAIITDGLSLTQWNKIGGLDLKRMIGKVVVTGDWGRAFWKPHLRAFKEVMGTRQPAECCYIADNPQKDFIAPFALEWAQSVRIRRMGSMHVEVPTPKDCIEIASLAQLNSKQ